MNRKAAVLAILFLLVIVHSLSPVEADSDVIRVPHDYPTMQEAVDAASPGDTIILSEGWYSEGEIKVYKPLALIAEGDVIVDGEWLYPWWEPRDRMSAVFLVTSDNVTIRGFTVVDTSGYLWGAAGILLYDEESGRLVNNCKIEQNRFQRNWFGVFVIGFNNTVKENTFEHNDYDVVLGGLGADESGFNVVENNAFSGTVGVNPNSNCNTIKRNSIVNTNGVGMYLGPGTHHNLIMKNVITDSLRGIDIVGSHNNTVTGNTISGTEYSGIYVYNYLNMSSEFNVIMGNTVSNNGHAGTWGDHVCIWGGHAGIYLHEVSRNIIKKNMVRDNREGIYLASSNCNIVEKNIVMKNTRYGIAVTMKSECNTINENVAFHNHEFDLYWDGTGTDNIWTKNRYKSKNW